VLRSAREENLANSFGADILIQAPDPQKAALFYVNHLGFEITDKNPKMIGLHGQHINLFIKPARRWGRFWKSRLTTLLARGSDSLSRAVKLSRMSRIFLGAISKTHTALSTTL
jgi:hypothetical protein